MYGLPFVLSFGKFLIYKSMLFSVDKIEMEVAAMPQIAEIVGSTFLRGNCLFEAFIANYKILRCLFTYALNIFT